MSTHRRDFLRRAGALGTLAAIGKPGHCDAADAITSPDDGPDGKFDEQWQSYVDSGIYPPRPHLFLDDLFVDRMENVERVVHPPKKVGDQPLLRAEMPWEGVSMVFRNSVTYDAHDRCFKIWYRGFHPKMASVSKSLWAYATSGDGVHWERPELGLTDFEGSTKNNLISFGEMNDFNSILTTVVRDDREENPQRRFKGIGTDAHPVRSGEIAIPNLRDTGFETAGGLFAAYSADGIRWKPRRGWLAGMFLRDGSTLHGFNPDINQWVLWQRPGFLMGGRMIGVSYSNDFEHWTVPQISLAPDAKDPKGMQFDQLTSIASPDGGYIGLLACSGWQGTGFSSGEEVPQLVFAREPRVWTRINRKMWLEPGPEGSWEEGVVIPANPLVVGDEVFCFYYGKNRGAGWGSPTFDGKGTTTAALGLAKLERDRWVSIRAEGAGGSLTTQRIFFANNQLHVNVDARGGSLRAELQDGDGKPIAGYTLAESDPINVNSFDHLVTWRQGKSDFTGEIGTAINYPPKTSRALRVKFALENAHLFSFSC